MKNNSSNLPIINDLWNYSKPKETEEKFRALLPKAKEKNLGYYAELLTQLARTQSLQRNFETAHSILKEAKTIITPNMPLPMIRYHLELGRTHNSNQQKDDACLEFLIALELAQTYQQDFYAVDAAHMLGIAAPISERLAWTEKAIDIAEQSKDEKAKKWLGSLLNNIGWTYHDNHQYQKALVAFEKALLLRLKEQNPKRIFIAHWAIARTYRSLKRLDKAIQIQEKLLAEIEQKTAEPDGYVYEELAECYLEKGHETLTKLYFGKAYDLLSKDSWMKAHESNRLGRMYKLSR